MEQTEIKLKINRLGINGEGIGYAQKKTVFVPGAIPGETIQCKLIKDHGRYFDGKIKEILYSSNKRQEPPCKFYYECGGCQLQHIKYPDQLIFKKNLIIQALNKYSKLDYKISILDTIGMDDGFHYRNKMQMPFGNNHRRIEVGFYKVNTNDLIYISECLVHKENTNKTISQILGIINHSELSVYDRRSKKGILRYISIRENAEGQMMVTLVVVSGNKDVDIVCKKIGLIENVVSVYKNINSDVHGTEIIKGTLSKVYGEKEIFEELGNYKFNLQPNTFFQLNTKQTEVLYTEVSKLINPHQSLKVLDAYCGVGTIGQWISNNVKEVRGIDISKESIKSARKNCELNEINNCYYNVGKVEKIYNDYIEDGWIPDVAIFDPPRTGLMKQTLQLLLSNPIDIIIYISCNPSTLAKNINILKEKYDVKSIQPIDMFPQTSHVESITLMKKKN